MRSLARTAAVLVAAVLVASLPVLADGGGSGYTGSVEVDVGILPSFSTSLAGNLTFNSGEWSFITTANIPIYPSFAASIREKFLWTGEWLSIGAYADLGVVPFGFPGLGVILKATAEPWWMTSDTYLTFGVFALSEHLELGVTFLDAKFDTAGTSTLVGKATAGLSIAPTFSGLLTATFTLKAGDFTVESETWVRLFDFTIGESITLSVTFAPITAKAWVDFNSAGVLTIGIGAAWKFSG